MRFVRVSAQQSARETRCVPLSTPIWPELFIKIISLNNPKPLQVFYHPSRRWFARFAMEVIEDLTKIHRMRQASSILFKKMCPNHFLARFLEKQGNHRARVKHIVHLRRRSSNSMSSVLCAAKASLLSFTWAYLRRMRLSSAVRSSLSSCSRSWRRSSVGSVFTSSIILSRVAVDINSSLLDS